jgi:Ca2+-binding EF-hand superfamily protein
MREDEGKQIVKNIVDSWSRVYINQVFFIREYANILQYLVEFSKPHQTKPIPEGTVKVYFSLIQMQSDSGDDSGYEVEFNFENESLKHKLANTMRKNMFEQWINRVLENKLKIKLQLHLGTEFEYTRLVDKKGQKIDPFVPKYDIMKIQDLSKDVKKSQKIYVQSPRFIKTLERALVAILEEADVTRTGELSYQEFYNAFTKLQNYDLSENDMRMLLALADENENGKITWKDFIPHGINAVQVFLERNKQAAKKKDDDKVQLKPELLRVLYEGEIKKIDSILRKRFEAFDTDKETKKHSGVINFKEMQTCLHSTSHLTPKEINYLLRTYAMNQGVDQINYTNFAQDLYQARFQLADSRIMDINMEIIDKVVLDACAVNSEDGKTISMQALK